MKKARIKAAIEMLRAAERLYMPWYQSYQGRSALVYAESVEQLHACGNSACFAGYLALSDEFKKAGGSIFFQAPSFNGHYGAWAVADYLDIPERLAVSLIYGDVAENTRFSGFYGKDWHSVTKEDVIEKLEAILIGEFK